VQFILICLQSNLTVYWDWHKVVTLTALILWRWSVAQKYHYPKFHRVHQFGAVRQILRHGSQVHGISCAHLKCYETKYHRNSSQPSSAMTWNSLATSNARTLYISTFLNNQLCEMQTGTHSKTPGPLYQHNNNTNYAYWNIS